MLTDKIPLLLQHVLKYEKYLEHNRVVMDIFEGNLLPYITEDMRQSLSPQYFEKIEHRILPINILKRLIDKLSKAYSTEPIRTVVVKNEKDSELLDYYVDQLDMNIRGNEADEYSNMFKGFVWEPYLDGEKPQCRTLPFDKFIPYCDSLTDPLKVTVMIKIMGKKEVDYYDEKTRSEKTEERSIFYAYSDDEFLAFDSSGAVYAPAMQDNNGENVIDQIPMYYGHRSRTSVIPTQDTDLLRMTKVIPVIFSDLSGAILFQCFSIIWGVDIDFENMTMAPNALWSLKSDRNAESRPQVGTIKPEADIDKVLRFIMQAFTLWLETKSIRVGSVGNVDAANVANGISKIIDEMDTTEIRKVANQKLMRDERQFWSLLAKMHNYWVDSGQIAGFNKFSEQFEVYTEYDEPKPMVDREKEVRTIDNEVKKGYLPPEYALKELYPDLSPDDLAEYLDYYNQINNSVVTVETTENSNQDTERVQPDREEGDRSGDN